MSYDATIAIAPLLDATRFGNPEWEREGRDSYWGGSLTLLHREGVPLLVDHEDNRQIGTVHALYELETDGGRWVCASATITKSPAWLRKGTPASFRRHDVHTVESAKGAERVGAAFVGEVSVLPPGVEPAEPLARVLLLERTPPAARSPGRATRDAAGVMAEHWQREAAMAAHARGNIVRFGVGEVLGVH